MRFDDLPEEVRNALKKLQEAGGEVIPIDLHDCKSGTWVQVAEMKPELRLSWRTYSLEEAKRKAKVVGLEIEAKLLCAQHEKAKDEMWRKIYEAHGLSPDESYKVEKDRLIMRRMDEKDEG